MSYDRQVSVDNYVEIGDFFEINGIHVINCVRKMWITLQVKMQAPIFEKRRSSYFIVS